MSTFKEEFDKSFKEALESIKDEEGMSAYSYYNIDKDSGGVRDLLGSEKTIVPEKISYGDANFKNFDVREVFVDGKSKGEFYVKLRNNNSKVHYNASLFLANRLTECEVGLIDPSNELKLDFHIYIKTNNELMIEAIMSIMVQIDQYITSQEKKK